MYEFLDTSQRWLGSFLVILIKIFMKLSMTTRRSLVLWVWSIYLGVSPHTANSTLGTESTRLMDSTTAVVGYKYIIITFCSGWYGILSSLGNVPRATIPFRGEIICHITLNKMWQLFYYIILWKISIWQFTVQNCMRRFLPRDMACDSSKYHLVYWLIRRHERQVICNKTNNTN